MRKIFLYINQYFRRLVQDETRPYTVFFLVLILAALAYRKSFYVPFYFDDYDTIVNNPLIKHFYFPVFFSHYKVRFLTNLTFVMNYALNGLNVFGWHLVNFLIHIGNTFWVYLLITVIFKTPRARVVLDNEQRLPVALFGALIFALHPIQTEAVTYIVQRATLLASFFYMGALYFYIRGKLTGEKKYYWVSFFFVLCGLLSKPVIVTWPLAVLCVHWMFFGKPQPLKRRNFSLIILSSLSIILLPIFLFGAHKLLNEAAKAYRIITIKEYALTQVSVLVTYLRLLFVPIHQNLDYDYPITQTFFDPRLIFSASVLLAVLFLSIRFFKKNRVLSFSILWFFITLAPQSSFFPLLDVIYEHRVYLACFGFALFLPVALSIWIKNRRIYTTVMVLFLCLLSILTYRRNVLWRDQSAFLNDIVLKSPNKARPHNNLGHYYYLEGYFKKAEIEFKKALVLDPTYYVARTNLAIVYLKEGKLAEAKKILDRLTRIYPDYPAPHLALGQLYQELGNIENATKLFQYVIYKDPYNANAYAGLANIYQKRKLWDNALAYYNDAIWLKPESPYFYYNLGNLYIKVNDYYEAILSYKKALRFDPNFAEAYNNLGSIYSYYLKDYESAVGQYQQAVSVNPLFAEAYFNMANALKALGQDKEAQAMAEKALALYKKQGKSDMVNKLQGKMNP